MTEITNPVPVADDGSSAIARQVDVESTKHIHSDKDLETFYEISKTANVISQGGYKRVALQFPDELLADSTAVSMTLADKTGAKVFVLADTSYGSCCVDEVAAQHCDADFIVHYGHTCLSLTSRLPVLYIYCRLPIHLQNLVNEFKKQFDQDSDLERKYSLLYHVSYTYIMDEIINKLKEIGYRNVTKTNVRSSSRPYIPAKSTKDDICSQNNAQGCCQTKDDNNNENNNENGGGCCSSIPQKTDETLLKELPDEADDEFANARLISGRSFDGLDSDDDISDYTLIYIGAEGMTLTNIMLTNSTSEIYSYNPDTKIFRYESTKVNRHLSRRFLMVQKAKDAEIIGIVIGTLGVSQYMSILEDLKAMIKKARKKFYVFVVGKLNVPKLANFMEIEVFVIVACPENTLIDSKEFYQPVVTPYELKLALSTSIGWDGTYITDFKKYLSIDQNRKNEDGIDCSQEGEEEDKDIPHYSLVTGTLKSSKYHVNYDDSDEIETSGGDVAIRNNTTHMIKYMNSAGADYLLSRSYQGLGHDVDKNISDDEKQSLNNEDPGADIVEGRSGIARGYENENSYR
ncbi:Diphthamide biosynthesis protein 2 [Mycoemilia scoparia]|uniref:2-(3-amino-3-carboxypropyl)histidine synthase subunit 2 n=1 Tax=Mycoemilia scoparia TaxID=417184 RepID=A0A9W7ZVW1_9FUNG|nr:Diphthamide biosynthesis protein 2 [Mycoemilia scoparia]